MPKRSAGVNKIIFELDDHDTGSESGEDVNTMVHRSRGKRARGAAVRAAAQRLASIKKAHAVDTDCVEVIDLESSGVIDIDSSDKETGGSVVMQTVITQSKEGTENDTMSVSSSQNISSYPDPNISVNILDSVESDVDEAVAGCENRTPLITVKFRDKHIARHCRSHLKQFICTLLSSLPLCDNLSDSESDLELDIWPENKTEATSEAIEMDLDSRDEPEDIMADCSLFFVDTNPDAESNNEEIPRYCQSTTVMKDGTEETNSLQRPARPQHCFNCDGDHLLHQCPLPKNYSRINQARKERMSVKIGRYHVEDEQKYGHLVAGRISGRLRHALGLKRDELPLHIYRMRLYGYPPGWLQEARIQHSGITMFDSEGQAIQDPDEEAGEVCEPGSKDKFDIKKILDFPGFNVPPSKRYKDMAHHYGLPPMSERDSKMLMLETLAPNAMQAYKRKKLTLFPSAANGDSSLAEGTADMEIASDEEADVSFPSVPPLPDEAPASAPPPPDEPAPPSPPPPTEDVPTPPPPPAEDAPNPPPTPTEDAPKPPRQATEDTTTPSPPPIEDASQQTARPKSKKKSKKQSKKVGKRDCSSSSIDASTEPKKDSHSRSARSSPSLTDLEEHKKMLLQALQSESYVPVAVHETSAKVSPMSETAFDSDLQQDTSKGTPSSGTPKMGQVKHSDFGTPVVNVASPFTKLPTEDKFAKDICDVINFENLPDSIGTFKKMSTLLKRVKDEVNKIQES